jgi:hypothetical protein
LPILGDAGVSSDILVMLSSPCGVVISNIFVSGGHTDNFTLLCDPIYSLCDQAFESAPHLCLHCVYAQEVWLMVATWSEGLVQVPALGITLGRWWNQALLGVRKEDRRRKSAILLYTT